MARPRIPKNEPKDGLLPSPISSAKSSKKSSRKSSPIKGTNGVKDDSAVVKKRQSSRLEAEQRNVHKKYETKQLIDAIKLSESKPNLDNTGIFTDDDGTYSFKQISKKNEPLDPERRVMIETPLGKIATDKGLAPLLVEKMKTKPFVEPPLADPVPSVTGLPLGAPPSSKIKKERLWPVKRGKRGRPPSKKQESSDDDDHHHHANTDNSGTEFNPLEKKYKGALKTTVNEKLQKPSEMRYSMKMKPTPKKGSDIIHKMRKPQNHNTSHEPPLTPRKRQKSSSPAPERDDGVKRKIKNASPKKARRNAFGFETQLDLPEKRDSAPDFADATKDNDDFCSSCGEPGIFLCCESCPKSFHFACCDPPYYEENLPESEWFCNECSARKSPPTEQFTGLFGKLLNQVQWRNPIQFKLPKKIRNRFEGVITGEFGEYEDSAFKSFNPSQVYAFDQTDPALHFDKNGNPIVCIKCGTSGIGTNKVNGDVDKLIIQCEYCPSAWHLDCLDPPLSTVKQLGTKWKCPNHSDHLIPDKPRRLNKPTIVDVDQTRGYKNNGLIDIKSDNEEDGDDEDDSDRDEEDYEVSAVDIPTPPHMNTYDTQNGVAAKLSQKTMKQWSDPFVITRIPEKGIVLDFIGKCTDERIRQRKKIDEIWELSKENTRLLNQIDAQYGMDEKHTIKSLVELKEADFRELVDVASKELAPPATLQEPVKVEDYELQELLQIKKLMKLKGKERLLSFLREK